VCGRATFSGSADKSLKERKRPELDTFKKQQREERERVRDRIKEMPTYEESKHATRTSLGSWDLVLGSRDPIPIYPW
jgi:hypothetical protein